MKLEIIKVLVKYLISMWGLGSPNINKLMGFGLGFKNSNFKSKTPLSGLCPWTPIQESHVKSNASVKSFF